MRTPSGIFVLSLLLGSFGCSSGAGSSPVDNERTKPAASTPLTASGSASAVASTAPIASALPETPVCKIANQKVLAHGVNKLTGLTVKHLDEKRYGLGFASGLTPQVLVVNNDGQVSVLKVETKAGSKVASPPAPAEGNRLLWRVTPVAVDGSRAHAFVDYRDEYKDKRRHVACGPAESDEEFISFDGVPFNDRTPRPTADERKPLFSSKEKGLEGYVELRDCRTFITRKTKETWAVGSELHGVEAKDGSIEWSSVLVVDFGAKEREHVLHETKLKADPPKVLQYEIPVSRRVEDKGFLLATRLGNELLVGVLDKDKKLKGKFSTYPGFPLLPDIARVGTDEVITVAVSTAPKAFTLKSLVVPMATLDLPAAYSDVHVDDNPLDAETEPEMFEDKKGQRWISYIEGERDKGHLEIIPLDAKLHAAGRAFTVTEDKERASEARLFQLDSGAMLIAFLRDTDGKTELVTEELTCEVKAPGVP